MQNIRGNLRAKGFTQKPKPWEPWGGGVQGRVKEDYSQVLSKKNGGLIRRTSKPGLGVSRGKKERDFLAGIVKTTDTQGMPTRNALQLSNPYQSFKKRGRLRVKD